MFAVHFVFNSPSIIHINLIHFSTSLVTGFFIYAVCLCVRYQDYSRMLDLMRDIILATDLAHHLRIFKDLQRIADRTYQ